MQRMDNAPYSFLMEAKPKDFEKLKAFKYRTLNGRDLIFILHALKKMYRSSNSLEEYFLKGMVGQTEELGAGIHFFRNEMLKVSHEKRSEKHISTPVRNSACKKICMFLRWMVRKDAEGVDFGLWTKISPSALCLPLDVHAGATARKIGLLKRKQNDWKAVLEITEALRDFDDKDPVRFDYALFGMGIRKSQTQ